MADTTKYKKGGGESCVVVGCSNSRRHLHQWKTEECLLHGISHDSCPCLLPFSLHRMPDKEDVRLAWCAAINRPTDSLPKRVIVCSDHFIDGRPTAQNNVPSLKLDYEKEVKQGRRIFKRRISENITDTPRIPKKKKYVFLGACPKYWYNKKGNRTCGDNSSKDLRSVERAETWGDNHQDTALLSSNSFDIKQEPMTDDQEGVNFEHSYVDERTENQSDNYQDTTLLPSNSFDIKQEPMTADQEGVNFEHSYINERTENQSDNYQDTTFVNFENSYVTENTETRSDNRHDAPSLIMTCDDCDLKDEPNTDEEGANKSFDHSYAKSSPAHDSSAPDYDFSVMGKQSTEIFGGDCNTDARSSFQTLKEKVKVKLTLPYASISIDDNDDDDLEIMELYRKNGKTSVKLTINIDKTFKARVLVHRKEVSVNHLLWIGLPPRFNSYHKISNLLSRLRQFAVCLGNPDEEFQSLVPFDQSDKGSSEIFAYKEGDFCAEMGEMSYSSTIRSVDCELLVEGRRCSRCATYRRSLWAQKHRLEDKTKLMDKNLLKSNYKHKDMTKEMLIEKIRQQKMCIDSLQQELNQSRREIKKGMRS